MSNLTDFFPSGGGGGLTPKFEEFNASGTFTPSQALIDAGGYIEVFLVAGGGRSNAGGGGGLGGEAITKKMYLNSVTSIAVTIGAGGPSNGSNGGNSTFAGSSAGGNDFTCLGGIGNLWYAPQNNRLSPGWSSKEYSNTTTGAGNGVFGYGAGGAGSSASSGVGTAKANSGQGSGNNQAAGSGYCLIKWYE